MPAEAAHITDVHRQVVARLPLNVQRAVHSVGKFVVPRIRAQIEGWRTARDVGADILGTRHATKAGRSGGWNDGCRIPGGINDRGSPGESELIAVGNLSGITEIKRTGETRGAELRCDEGRLLV